MPSAVLLLAIGLAGRGLGRTRPSPLNAATLATLPPVVAQDPWRWKLRTDDGLALDASDLREKRSYWLRDLISIGKSRVLIRVADRLFGTTLWAAVVAVAYELERNTPGIDLMLKQMMETLLVPTWPHEAVGGFLAILLVFRTDQAYERFWEARGLWASVHTSTRALAMLALSHYGPGPTRDMLLAHSTAFPLALKQHLRGQRNLEDIERIFEAYSGPHAAAAERAGAPGSSAIDFIRASDNLPSTMLASLSLELAALLRAERLDVDDPNAPRDPSGQRQAALWTQLQNHVEGLTEVIACCERLKLTPIPLSYSRHTSRFFTLYLLTLPFTLVRECNALTVPAICLGIGYVLYAMEEIGHVIEEPFSLAAEAGDEAVTDFSPQSTLARGGTNAFLGLVSGFYRMLAMVLAYKGGLDDPETDRGVQPLEVLPLRKYCAIIELEIANVAALVVAREGRAPRDLAHGGFGSGVKGLVGRTFQRIQAAPAHGGARGADGDAERYRAIAEAAVVKLHDLNESGAEGMP